MQARREETGAGARIIRICSHAKKKGRAIADAALAGSRGLGAAVEPRLPFDFISHDALDGAKVRFAPCLEAKAGVRPIKYQPEKIIVMRRITRRAVVQALKPTDNKF